MVDLSLGGVCRGFVVPFMTCFCVYEGVSRGTGFLLYFVFLRFVVVSTLGCKVEIFLGRGWRSLVPV